MPNYAVLIGIDEYTDRRLKPLRYAEKDCTDFGKLLLDRSLSSFAPEHVTVLTGANATTRNIEAALYKTIIRDRSAEDGVLVYFSGHGFIAGGQDLAYLGTHDVNVSDLLDNPNVGLRMDRIHDDFFRLSPARNVLFILDCCHSGALTPALGGAKGARRELVAKEFFTTGMGRTALFACPPDSVCRESASLRNGIFTHYVLRGLRGDAVESGTGEVTIDSLLAYVRRHTPEEQLPGSYGATYGRTVLTRPGVGPDMKSYAVRRHEPAWPSAPIVSSPLSNPLDPYIPFIETLVARLTQESLVSQVYLDRRILEIVRQVCGAEFIFLLRADKNEYLVKAHSEIDAAGDEGGARMEGAVSRAIAVVDRLLRPRRIYYNVRCPYEAAGGEAYLVIIPVSSTAAANEYLVFHGVGADAQLLDDACCNILSALYTATQSLTSLQPKSIKAALLDNVKKNFYNHVPLAVYETRLALFKERLQELTIHFQPVLHLEPQKLHICGWEALARDPATQLAPTDVFQAAEIWGRQFVTELDTCLARRAVECYRVALEEARMRRPYEIQELSINAYPSSLMRTSYFEALRDALKENGLSGRNVVIEILEKEAIPVEAQDIRTYRRHLEQFARNLQVTFGIDDFGVGHSSVERLAHLDVQYVKIDKEVLHLAASDQAIKFVLDIVSFGRMGPVKVIVEGFDGSGTLDLKALYRLGVRYIQGYVVGKARPHLYRMGKEEMIYFENLLQAA